MSIDRTTKLLYGLMAWFTIWMITAQAMFPYLTNMSRLGTNRHTIVPYVLAMISGICFVLLAAQIFYKRTPGLAKLLRAGSAALFIVIAVPFTLNWLAALIHNLATMVFSYIAAYVTYTLGRYFVAYKRISYALTITEICCILGELTCILLGTQRVPSWAWGLFEVIFSAAFALAVMLHVRLEHRIREAGERGRHQS